jgi:hypothetical protein
MGIYRAAGEQCFAGGENVQMRRRRQRCAFGEHSSPNFEQQWQR